MFTSLLNGWLNPVLRRFRHPRRSRRGRRRTYRPQVEGLEDRLAPATFTVTNLNDSGTGSLRQAITNANSMAGDDTIAFQAALTGIIQLSSVLPDLSTNIAINGPGANVLTVRRNVTTEFRIFTVSSGSTVSMSGLTISNGSGDGGGGISNSGTLAITNSTVSGNFSGNSAPNLGGGGIRNSGTLTISNSTVSGNSAGHLGGGIRNLGALTISNSTVSGNSSGTTGGGIENSHGGTLTITNSTISGNSTAPGFCGGGIFAGSATSLRNTIIAGNTTTTCGPDVQGTISSQGNNLIGSGGTGFGASDLLNVDARLGPLRDNGGPTFTHALLLNSPAIDAGANAGAPGGLDQRGFTRIVDGTVDIGAFEVQQYLVTTTADSGAGSLRTALTNTNLLGGGIIAFATAGTINLVSALPNLSGDVDIRGPGANVLTVRRNVTTPFRIFTVDSGTGVSISGLTISNGSSSANGGGISNSGSLTITSSTVSGNSATTLTQGGGVFNSGTLTITNSTISGNSGGSLGGGIRNSGTLTIANSTISGNFALSSGGGINNSGTLTITNSTVSGNSTGNTFSGGGIATGPGTTSIRNTIIAGNTATSRPDVSGTVTSLGDNLIGNTSGGSGFVASDLQNVNPLLGPLRNNGGPTPTHALLPGSPAIDAGSNTGAPLYDQRGATFPRVVNGTADIGAFEYQNAPAIRSIPRTAFTINVGQTLTLNNVAFSGRQVPHVASIDWGDGSPSSSVFLAAGDQEFNASHAYATGGSFPITVTVTADDQSGSDTVLLDAAVGTPTPPANLVSWWTGDGNPTLTVPDIAGSNPGTLVGGARYVAGLVGQAFDFNGTGARVEVAIPNVLGNTTATWSLWMRTTQSGAFAGLMGKHDAGSVNGVTLFVDSGGHAAALVKNATQTLPLTGTTLVNDGQFHHVAVSFQSGGTSTLYVDGRAEATGTAPTFTMSSNPLRLGRLIDPFYSSYLGVLDEVQVHGRVLSAPEIQQIVNAGSLGQVKGIFVGANTLQLQTLTPTNTGFSVLFNRAIDPSVLNLYDTQTAGLGAADVTLVGSTSGPIRGSLVLNTANTGFTFIATGGVLPANDTYTLTLRSAANGFKDTLGNLLDGNGDGTAGDNYTGNFTVPPSSARVVSIPNFTRGPGQPANVPANVTTGIPLTLSDGAGVDSVDLTIVYNPALLTITNAVRGPSTDPNAIVTINTTTPGRAVIGFSSPVVLAGTNVAFVTLTATVPDMAPYTSKHVLDLTGLRVNDGGIAARDDDGIHVVAYFGDVTANAGYSSTDATRTLRVAVGLDGGFDTFQLADPVVIADITANGDIGSSDATRILQEAVGIDQPTIPPPGTAPLFTPGGPDPYLNFPTDMTARPGDVVTVPLLLDLSDGLESADVALSYDPRRLGVLAVQRGDLTEDFDLFAVNLDREKGTLRAGLGRTAGAIEGRGSGSVLLITFQVRDDAPAGPVIINLRQAVAQTLTQLNEGGLDLIPDPSDEEGDVLDGLITIAGEPGTLVPGESTAALDFLRGLTPPARWKIGPEDESRKPVFSDRSQVDVVFASFSSPAAAEGLADLVRGAGLKHRRSVRERSDFLFAWLAMDRDETFELTAPASGQRGS